MLVFICWALVSCCNWYIRLSGIKTTFACRGWSLTNRRTLWNKSNSFAFLSEYRFRKVYKFPVLYPPDFFWCKCHPDAHPLPFQNLSPYIFLLHQLEHFLPPSHDGLPTRKDETCYSVIRLSWKLNICIWPTSLQAETFVRPFGVIYEETCVRVWHE